MGVRVPLAEILAEGDKETLGVCERDAVAEALARDEPLELTVARGLREEDAHADTVLDAVPVTLALTQPEGVVVRRREALVDAEREPPYELPVGAVEVLSVAVLHIDAVLQPLDDGSGVRVTASALVDACAEVDIRLDGVDVGVPERVADTQLLCDASATDGDGDGDADAQLLADGHLLAECDDVDERLTSTEALLDVVRLALALLRKVGESLSEALPGVAETLDDALGELETDRQGSTVALLLAHAVLLVLPTFVALPTALLVPPTEEDA